MTPGMIADIVDGRFKTLPGKGTLGGAYTVRIRTTAGNRTLTARLGLRRL